MTPEIEGGVTKHLPGGDVMSIYDAAMLYRNDHVPLVVLAGAEYGTGSSRRGRQRHHSAWYSRGDRRQL